MLKILIVDDERDFRSLLRIILNRNGYETAEAKNGIEAIKIMETQNFHVVLTDLVMEGCDGIELLKHISTHSPDTDTILMTAYGSIENAVEAMKLGAFSYFIKSNDPQEILFNLDKIKTIRKLHVENQVLKDAVIDQSMMLESKSKTFKQALDYAKRAADSNSNILILGESGVGKEVFARFIHMNSPRREHVFMPVNCYSFSETLIESELYGHENGAFTGSSGLRIGRFEAADQGTLFLDEIGDLPESTQIKILRNIETKEINRIGSNQSIKTDFRLISATHKNIEKAISDMQFREDLYYRISTVIIEIPPLRDRMEDVPLLIDYFIHKAANDMKKPFHSMDTKLKDILYTYDYPGNIRELKNIIERLVVMSYDGILRIEDGFRPSPFGKIEKERSLKAVRQESEKKHILSILDLCHYDFNVAAQILEISARQLYNKCNEYDIPKNNK